MSRSNKTNIKAYHGKAFKICHHSATYIRAGYGLVKKQLNLRSLLTIATKEPCSGALAWKDVRGVDDISSKSSRSMWDGNTFGRWLY